MFPDVDAPPAELLWWPKDDTRVPVGSGLR